MDLKLEDLIASDDDNKAMLYTYMIKWRVSIYNIISGFFAFCFWLGDQGCKQGNNNNNNNVDADKMDICLNMYYHLINYIYNN